MNILKRFFQYKIYRKMIISYLLLLVLTISLVSTILFSMFSSSTVKEISSNSKAMLSQTSYASDVIYDQVMNIAKQMTFDNDVVSYLFAKTDDKVALYNASLSLTHILTTYPFIKYIELVNLVNGNYYNTLPIAIDLIQKGKEDTVNLLRKTNDRYFTFTPRIQTLPQNSLIRTLSFVFYPDFLSSNNHVIIINIDEQYIQNTIKSLSRFSNTFAMDNTGIVLSHTDISNFMDNLSNEDYIKEILSSSQQQDSSIRYIDGTKYLVTFVKSNAMNWFFVSITPYEYFLGNINKLRLITLLISFLLFIMGLNISLLLTSSIYNPMKSLLEKMKPSFYNPSAEKQKYDEYKTLSDIFSTTQENFESLKTSVLQSSSFVKEKYILNLLQGNLSAISASEDIMSEIREQFTGPVYYALVFKIDRYSEFIQNTTEESRALIRLSLCNTTHDFLKEHFQNNVIIMEENEIAAVVQCEEHTNKEDLMLLLMELQGFVKNNFPVCFSIGVGEPVYSDRNIHLSYKGAKEFVKYRFFHGPECITDQSTVYEHNAQICKYPSSCEKKILKALQLGNQNQVDKGCDDFIKQMKKASYYQTINYSTQLMLSIIKNFQDSLNLVDDDFKLFFSQINRLSSLETIQETLSEIKNFCSKIRQLQEEKNSKIYTQKHTMLVEEIKAYVMQHYSDPGLSLDAVADVVKLSSGYLGKLFKNVMNLSFSDYLTKVRLEKSKDLLVSTCEPAFKICESVGIYNTSYYFTLFKKFYGLTPSQYREQNVRK